MIDERGAYVQTLRGGRYHLTNPTPDELSIGDIAHALSQLCRFTGQTQRFYSVAQHCVIVSEECPPELALDGLLHDASEAYVGDLTSPLKWALQQIGDQGFGIVEDLAHEAIARKFGTSWPHDPAVKVADTRTLATEARDLMAIGEGNWDALPEPYARRIDPLGPAAAEEQFLARFHELAR